MTNSVYFLPIKLDFFVLKEKKLPRKKRREVKQGIIRVWLDP